MGQNRFDFAANYIAIYYTIKCYLVCDLDRLNCPQRAASAVPITFHNTARL